MASFFSLPGRLIAPVLLSLVGLGACQPEPAIVAAGIGAASAISPLEARVLARHDSLMALTDRLFELRRRLGAGRGALSINAALRVRFAPRLDSATRATLRADDAMMDWMHAYHRPAAGTAPDSAATYFQRQLRVLAVVEALTHRALDSASAVLRALPPPAAPAN